MASKGTSIITPDVNNPGQDVQVFADGPTNALLVKVVNPGGGSGGGSVVQYLEDAPHTTGDTGSLALVVRRDAPGSLVNNDGDYAPLQVDAVGRLRVAIDDAVVLSVAQSGPWNVDVSGSAVNVSGSVVNISAVNPGTAAGLLGKAHDQVFSSADVGVMALAVYDDTGAFTLPPGGLGRYAVLTVDGASRLRIAGEIETLLRVIPGTTSIDLGKAEDAPHNSGDVGVMFLAVRRDVESTLANANGDYAPPQLTSTGRLRTSATVTGPSGLGLEVYKSGDPVPTRPEAPTFLCEVIDSPTLGTLNVWTHPFIDSNDGGLLVHVRGGITTTNSEKSEDVGHVSGSVGQFVLAVRRDTLSVTTSAAGNYASFSVDSVGALWTRNAGVTTLALSGSTRGRPIQITGTATGSANTLHTATTTSGQLDRVFIDLTNTSNNSVVVTIEFGTTGVGNELSITVPPHETVKAVDGMVLGGGATDTIRAYAATASVINAVGRVERLS